MKKISIQGKNHIQTEKRMLIKNTLMWLFGHFQTWIHQFQKNTIQNLDFFYMKIERCM